MAYNKLLPVMLLSASLLACPATRAQSTADLLEQLSLDIQKLASMKTLLQEMYQGYEIVQKGLSDIKDIEQGNFNLHKVFLDGLLAVSPAVQNDARIAEIITAEYTIVSEYKASLARLGAGGRFTASELDYISGVYSALFQQSLRCIDELTMVITADQLRMSDDQRLQTIDRVHTDITGQLRFLRQFDNSASIQDMQRLKEANDLSTLKALYGID